MDEKRARFDAEVLPHLDAAYRFARWLSRSRTDAEDIVQDAVLRAFRGFDRLRSSDSKAWFLTIVRNCHSTTLQKERRRAHVPLPPESTAMDAYAQTHAMASASPDPESASIQWDQERLFERLLSRLPDEQREVLVLREIEEMDYRQIASVINVPIGTVMSRLARARVALRASWHADATGADRELP